MTERIGQNLAPHGERLIRPLAIEDVIAEKAVGYKASLPPVNPACKLTIVIPVYKEFRFGRIQESLEELTTQTAPPSNYEVILVVNNPRPDADTFGNSGYHDNKTLLLYLRTQQLGGNFQNVRIIDATEEEYISRHLGKARGLGNEIAERRLSRTVAGDEGVIVQLDGDTAVEPTFIEEMLQAYEDSSLQSAIIARMPLAHSYGRSEGYYVSLAAHFSQDVGCVLRGDEDHSASGQTISFRAKHHRRGMRRYMRKTQNEDSMLSKMLWRNTKTRVLPTPRVFVADRERPEGFDAAIRESFVRKQAPWTAFYYLLSKATSCSTYVALPILNKQIFEESPKIAIAKTVSLHLRTIDTGLEVKFLQYTHEEVLRANFGIDIEKADREKILEGAMLFALARIVLEAEATKRSPNKE